jgi:protein SCO1/2
MTRLAVWSVIALLSVAGTAPAQYGRAPDREENPTPPSESVRIEQRLGEQVPLGLEFRDEQNRAVTLGECVGGKPTVLVLAYYRCPQLCSQVLNGLTDVLRAMPVGRFDVGDQFNVVTVSFDPKEKPALAAAKKQSYVEEYGRPGAENGWHFLTGSQESITALTQAVGFGYEYDEKRKLYNHASGIMILTPDGKLARYFFGIDFVTTPENFRNAADTGGWDKSRDVRYALMEASGGKIGSKVENAVRLLCYHWDPAAGKYTKTAMVILRVAAAVTVLALGAVLFGVWRRARRKADVPVTVG